MEVEDRLEPRVCKQALACTLELLEVVDMPGLGDRTGEVSRWVQV